MTSQYQYQLDTEYRNRQMMKAENARLAQEVQSDQSKRNYVSAFINGIRNIFRSVALVQVKSTVQVADTQVQQSPVNA